MKSSFEKIVCYLIASFLSLIAVVIFIVLLPFLPLIVIIVGIAMIAISILGSLRKKVQQTREAEKIPENDDRRQLSSGYEVADTPGIGISLNEALAKSVKGPRGPVISDEVQVVELERRAAKRSRLPGMEPPKKRGTG